MRKLVEVKREHANLFACGNEFELVSETYPLVYKRTSGDETLICAINPSEREYTVDVKVGEVLASANAEVTEDGITLKETSYVWMKVIE